MGQFSTGLLALFFSILETSLTFLVKIQSPILSNHINFLNILLEKGWLVLNIPSAVTPAFCMRKTLGSSLSIKEQILHLVSQVMVENWDFFLPLSLSFPNNDSNYPQPLKYAWCDYMHTFSKLITVGEANWLQDC